MTNEEARAILEEVKTIDDSMYQYNSAYLEALDTAIAALKAEPCEDCVSLDGVIDTIEWYRTNPQHFTEDNLIEDIKGLPPVTPKQRTGQWEAFIHNAYYGTDEDGEPIWREKTVYHCNQCNRRTVIKEKFCPNCGAKMEGESE